MSLFSVTRFLQCRLTFPAKAPFLTGLLFPLLALSLSCGFLILCACTLLHVTRALSCKLNWGTGK